MKPTTIRPLQVAIGSLTLVAVGLVWYVRANPRIFNESFWGHAHCINMAGGALSSFTFSNQDAFPTHTNGYGDALLLVANDNSFFFECLTGPGYSGEVFRKAKATGANVNEAECGRVYIQGLKIDSDREIAVLFDKLPTPGDHTHGFSRFTRSFGREVLFVGGGHQFIPNKDWPAFATNQIKLLVEAGIPESVAKSYYENLPD